MTSKVRASYLIATAAVLIGAVAIWSAPPLLRSKHHHRSKAFAARPHSPLPAASKDGVLADPIDPRFLTEVPFGHSSFWIQPWRAYLDTWPASRLLDSLGIDFNVKPAAAQATARVLHESGFKLARIEINWSSLSYDDPSRFSDEANIRTRLRALRDNDLRPLILLDANSGAPTPARSVTLQLSAPAPAGADTVRLSPASAAAVIPGRTGFSPAAFGQGRPKHRHKHAAGAPQTASAPLTPQQRRARREQRRAERHAQGQAGLTALVREGNPAILITKLGPGGVATLSRPLPTALQSGEYRGSTLLYAPFGAPDLPGGKPDPSFHATLAGWLAYVNTVCKYARSIFGPAGFDLEVWNELSFGSQFLNSTYYSSPAGAKGLGKQTQAVARVLLDETVRFVRDPANGISAGVGITDGFADQTPFTSGAQAPLGLTALSKHLYAGAKEYPADYHEHAIRPLNALGARDTLAKSFTPLFIPHFQSLFPEYYLSALSTETVVRDIAPITTTIYGDPHGREVGPPGGTPPQKWMTEYNLSTHGATIVGPDQSTPIQTTLTPADKTHFHTKALLRSLVSTINKGMTREYFYAATGGELGIVNPSFFSALENHPETYPGPALGGETLTAFKNMLAQFQGPGPGQDLKQLKLTNITQDGEHAQFTGDTTTAHPNLYDREVLAVLPFQSSPTRFEIPIYVMTRNLLTLYQPNAPTTNPTRFDLPNETFQITLTNLPQTNTPPTITLYDPIQNKNTPAHLTNQTNNTTTIEIQATDYPRILTINYGGS